MRVFGDLEKGLQARLVAEWYGLEERLAESLHAQRIAWLQQFRFKPFGEIDPLWRREGIVVCLTAEGFSRGLSESHRCGAIR